MALRTVMMDQVRGRRVEDVLREIVRGGEEVAVVLDDGQAVVLRPASALKALPTLEGRVPEGWKDAVYGA